MIEYIVITIKHHADGTETTKYVISGIAMMQLTDDIDKATRFDNQQEALNVCEVIQELTSSYSVQVRVFVYLVN